MTAERQALHRLLTADMRFGAFLTAFAGGWKDSNGHAMPGGGDLRKRLQEEVQAMQEALDQAKKDLAL